MQVVLQHYRMRADPGLYQFHGTGVPLFTVARPAELAPALAQREKPVVIQNTTENKFLLRWVKLFVLSQRWLLLGGLGAIAAYAIHQGYKVELRRTEWHGDTTIQHEIILTPVTPNTNH